MYFSLFYTYSSSAFDHDAFPLPTASHALCLLETLCMQIVAYERDLKVLGVKKRI